MAAPSTLGELNLSQGVPTQVTAGESFIISGNWPGAHHISVSEDGVNWTNHTGDNFSQTLTLTKAGTETIQIAARNTEFDTDPGTERKEESYDVTVVTAANTILVTELTSTSVKVKVGTFTGKTVRLIYVPTGNQVLDKVGAAEVEFTALNTEEKYRVAVIDSYGNEETGIDVITGLDDIYITNISQGSVRLEQM